MSYKVGQEVVCINSTFDTSDPDFYRVFKQLPKKGITYTIREYDAPSIKLEEVQNSEVPMDMGGITMNEEPGFNQNRFAPLIEGRQGMSESSFNTFEPEVKEYELIEVEETEEFR
jgi:hypothetical protein